MQKDYYKTLGVLDTAEEAVIRGAYKALVQIYHPDRYLNGSKEQVEASHKIKEINEAYRILSTLELRNKFDQERAAQRNQYEPESQNATDEQQKNDVLAERWEIATQFIEDLDEISASLGVISPELSFTFKLSVLESKRFEDASIIAEELENSYLQKYFGTNYQIHKFVVWLLHNQKRGIALEVNKAVNVLGSDFNASKIIEQYVIKYELGYKFQKANINSKRDRIQSISNIDRITHGLLALILLMLLAFFIKQNLAT